MEMARSLLREGEPATPVAYAAGTGTHFSA